eukprot:5266739-Alexandrium_andersonii.AAC.1
MWSRVRKLLQRTRATDASTCGNGPRGSSAAPPQPPRSSCGSAQPRGAEERAERRWRWGRRRKPR